MRKAIEILLETRRDAYAPYSGFKVGAVIETEGGTYAGSNLENASYGLTLCAEAVALSVLHMSRDNTPVKRVFVCGAAEDHNEASGIKAPLCTPCGACRQRLRERCQPETEIIMVQPDGQIDKIMKMQDILPFSFGPDNLT